MDVAAAARRAPCIGRFLRRKRVSTGAAANDGYLGGPVFVGHPFTVSAAVAKSEPTVTGGSV